MSDWEDTRDTLQLWTQVVGKVRLANTPLMNHWWNVPLYVTARGLTTGLVPHGARSFQIEFDFLAHRLESPPPSTARPARSTSCPGPSPSSTAR